MKLLKFSFFFLSFFTVVLTNNCITVCYVSSISAIDDYGHLVPTSYGR